MFQRPLTHRPVALLARAIAAQLLTAARLVAQADTAQTPDSGVRVLREVQVVGAPARSVPPPVATVEVPAERLVRTPTSNPYDLVRRAAGIEVHEQGQGPGFASDAVIRGFTSDHSSDVLLVIDGVPINLPLHGHVEGYADWSVLSAPAVADLRVIAGSASPLYGDFALGGVVEVTTAADASGRSGSLGGSSHGDVSGWLRAGSQSASGGGMLALDGRRDEGWRNNSGFWLGNAIARAWRRAGAGRIEGGVSVYGSTWDSPGFVSVDRFNDRDVERANDRTDGGDAERLIASGRFAHPLSEDASVEVVGWGQAVRSRVFLGVPDDGVLAQTEEEDRRLASGAQAQLRWQRGSGTLTAGVAARADWTRYELFETTARERGGTEHDIDGRFTSAGIFARWRGLLSQRLIYDVGGRADLLHYASFDRTAESPAWASGTPVVLSPKLGLRFLASGPLSVLASVSRGFRGAVGVIQDPSRPPVVAWAKELGLLVEGSGLRAELALFHTAVARERIQDPVTREISDAGTSVRRGVSADASVALSGQLRLFAEGTVNDAKITEAGGNADGVALPALSARAGESLRPSFHEEPLTPGAQVPGVARYFGRAGFEVGLASSWQGRASVRFTGPYTPIGEPSIRTRAYAVADLGGTIALDRRGNAIDIDLLNLFDARYPELRASGFVNPGSPRTLRAAVRFGRLD